MIDAGANDYITKLENAHGTEFGELLYPWHPWTGLRIGLHESVSKPDGIVFRCRLRSFWWSIGSAAFTPRYVCPNGGVKIAAALQPI